MRGGALPPALLFAALGFALAFAPRGRVLAVAVALAVAATVVLLPVPAAAIEWVFAGTWASVVVTALMVHARGLGRIWAALLAANAGLWSGAIVAVAGTFPDLAVAAAALALVVPAAWLAAGGRGIAVKVAASWLVAIALLAAVLPLVPTPGYAPDHME